MKNILFRADGNREMGLGHLYRIYALMEYCEGFFDCKLLSRESSDVSMFPSAVEVKKISNDVVVENEPDWLKSIYSSKDWLVVLDGYAFDRNYQKKLKEGGYFVILIDDWIQSKPYANIVINHSVNVQIDEYDLLPGTKAGLGSRYAMLRSVFARVADDVFRPNFCDNVFVCLGGADPSNISCKIVECLRNIEEIKQIHVVCGSQASQGEIEAMRLPHVKTYTKQSAEQMAALVRKCQLAIVSSSTILFEVCAAGINVLTGYYVENQKRVYEDFLSLGLSEGVGNWSTVLGSVIEKSALKLLRDKNAGQLTNQKKYFDGKYSKRILGLIHREFISSRKILDIDIDLVFSWANDASVRKKSYHSEKIAWETHQKWFLDKIESKNVLFLMMLVNQQEVGLVRYDMKNDHTVVSVLVSEKYRGQGLASAFLDHASAVYFKKFQKPVFAYIKKNNPYSIRAFEKAGYKFERNEKISGYESSIYRLDN